MFAIGGSGAFYTFQKYQKLSLNFAPRRTFYSSLVLAQAFEVGEGWRENNQQ